MSQLEESHSLIQNISPTTSNDLFKLENESVDLLLKEINFDPENLNNEVNSTTHTKNQPSLSLSINNSPTKPLKFPNNQQKSTDPNSSSDTYASEDQQIKTVDNLKSSFDRNFDIDTSMDLGKTISIPDELQFNNNNNKSKGSPVDEFSFQTPMTSAIDLTNKNQKDQQQTNSIKASPSKSILRKTPSSSPKKVAFTSTNPEIHHYPEAEFNLEESNIQQEIPNLSLQIPIHHQWSQPHYSHSEEESMASPPPPPPPHTSQPTYAELLKHDQERDDLDTETLTDLKLRHDNFSNLSLNEKMNNYLTKGQLSSRMNDRELDTHLIELEKASKYKTNNNIHDLSLSLQTSNYNIENPLDSLQKSPDVQLRSSGSSQSSLQSLRDTNRGLNSIPGSPTKANRGLELRDGIKGLPDSVVEALLPQDESEEGIVLRPSLNNSKSLVAQQMISDDNMDSFDRSFSHTEQSILNLLNSATTPQATKLNSPGEKQIDIKKETEDETPVENNKENTPEVKVVVKTESNGSLRQIISSEPVEPESLQRSSQFSSQLFKSENDVHVSAFTGLTPEEELRQLKSENNEDLQQNNSREMDEDSSQQQDDTRMSIRFHMDSDWKFEDSNDGDREDNDEVSKVLDKSDVMKESINSSQDDDYADASNEISQHVEEDVVTLAPPKTQEIVLQSKEDSEALANSSNIAEPHEDITLPQVEVNNYSSFDEVTKNMDTISSFEQSLSAENDIDKNKMENFISIWHSQEKQKKKQIHKVPTKQLIAAYQDEVNHRKNSVSTNQTKIPQSINQKKFKEVHVMSRRIVSPDFDDLHLSGFLPEISRDSAFNDLQFPNYSQSHRYLSSNSLNNQNVLSNIDNNPKIIEPPQPKTYSEIRHSKRLSSSQQLIDQEAQGGARANTNAKKSRFRVPTFEIKRSSSILSPRNMYDDIFDDVIGKKPPTIRAEGMRTLPSMDKDDVKRILSTRKGMTQDEYISAKFIEQKSKKNSIVTEAEDLYDKIQQTASIHDANIDSPKSRQVSTGIGADVLPYLADELRKSPRTLLSKNQPFQNDEVLSRANSVIIHSNLNNTLPEPDFALDFSPENVQQEQSPEIDEMETSLNAKDQLLVFDNVSPKAEQQIDPALPSTPVQEHKVTLPLSKQNSPTKRSPIKIGSPVRLIRKDGSITGIESPRRGDEDHIYHKPKPSFTGEEIFNHKLRDVPQQNTNLEESNQHIPSTVSVPSEYSESKQEPGLQHQHHDRHRSDPKVIDDEIPDTQLQESGKLFFRVVGLKNINLPDMRTQKGKFSITLDNGVHCVKTPEYELNSNAIPISKEFELTVVNSLQFILTMKCHYQKPRGTLVEVRERKVVKSKNKFARLFGSKDIITTTKYVPSEVKDNWANKFAIDGSFARCYIDFAQFEQQITGKVARFDLNCFNEWEITTNKTKLKPYKIAELEVEMLYIPKTEAHEILPTSIKSAYSSLQELNNEMSTYNEGYLHQEGGDCDHWKKRWFKLYATSLIAHSEFSHKTRAKINLNKIVDVQYIDKENIQTSHHQQQQPQQNNKGILKQNNTNGGNTRNFSDILLVEHSFKIKFQNGEIIIFGAPNYKEMKKWIEILENIVYRNKFRRQPWVNLMMKEQLAAQQQQQQ
ncbi:BUD4 [Candida jiufengensis]|uniref:BUD4 n=1 Tax=Candida jiufengensis TaxID=497108 RepID=UPI002224C81F|nr:BUD4 [Candida jiufengensis]KAI5956285.1 BUD4 [Candida jiufengensis]